MTGPKQPAPSPADGPPHHDDEAPATVAVGRTVVGILLALIGAVATIAGAIWFFVVPLFGWARDDVWSDLAEWADLGGAVLGIGGFVVLIIGAALIQRARKKRFSMFVDGSSLVSTHDKTPPTIPPII